ncbi:hypothetical protein [Sphingobium sp.]|uniref:hypothetical protein n=1 Tax=Sphingobium sp. TaxID=1912891 RepID=UPI002639B495|nr:hypothetical protein [Sphingobium sp.]
MGRATPFAMALPFIASGCSAAVKPTEYRIEAFASAGVQSDAEGTIIPDAATRLPALLKKCGVSEYGPVNASDSFVGFTFRLSSSDARTLDCIKAASPAGITLTENRLN